MLKYTLASMVLVLCACSTTQRTFNGPIVVDIVRPAASADPNSSLDLIAAVLPEMIAEDFGGTIGSVVDREAQPGAPVLTVRLAPGDSLALPVNDPSHGFPREVVWFVLEYTITTSTGSKSGRVLAVGGNPSNTGNVGAVSSRAVLQSAIVQLRREVLAEL